jgi:hypothetical protein
MEDRKKSNKNNQGGEIMDQKAPDDGKVQQPQQLKVKWDNSNMHSAYANVANVSGTREEIILFFGMNQAFNAQENEMTIQISNRVVMSPYVAKRLVGLLENVIKDYETKYGALDIK